MLISEEYRELNRRLHSENPDFGTDTFGWSRWAFELAKENAYETVLDYGCGKGRLSAYFLDNGRPVSEYDPAIAGKDSEPAPADLVVCTDVLEHIEPVHLNAVFRDLRRVTKKRLFATIFCGPASKKLPDGRNAHLIQKPGAWWRSKLLDHFQILFWEERRHIVAAELVAKSWQGRAASRKRRDMTPMLAAYLDHMRGNINAASDQFAQVKTMRLFEGVGDEMADLQGACNSIEGLDDIDHALGELARLSLKATFIAVKPDELITKWDWQRALEKRFRIGLFEETPEGHLLYLGNPAINVGGVHAIGAVKTEDRWAQVESAMARVRTRIDLAPVHNRTALLACYGPSLASTMDILKREMSNPDVDIVSVSGAHDFLLSRDIWPRYHIECDPRPHKALNISSHHPAVQYLIASCVHPDFFDRIEGADIKLWHISSQDHVAKLIACGENHHHIISGGGSVGLRAIPLLYALGYRSISIFGMDCSYSETGEKWAGKHAGKKEDAVECRCGNRTFLTSPVLMTYATGFFETCQKAQDISIRLYGDGLLQAMVRYYQELGQNPAQIDAPNEENA